MAPDRGVPAVAGAYILVFRLARPVSVRVGALFTGRLLPGTYLYFGSAYGPGGLRARIARHLGRRKRRHWHVDALCERVSVAEVLAFPGGDECRLRAELSGRRWCAPIPGFGSSDCRVCPAHLLWRPEPTRRVTVPGAIACKI